MKWFGLSHFLCQRWSFLFKLMSGFPLFKAFRYYFALLHKTEERSLILEIISTQSILIKCVPYIGKNCSLNRHRDQVRFLLAKPQVIFGKVPTCNRNGWFITTLSSTVIFKHFTNISLWTISGLDLFSWRNPSVEFNVRDDFATFPFPRFKRVCNLFRNRREYRRAIESQDV